MRRSSTDESTYRRSPSPEGKEPGFAHGGPFRRCSSLYGRGGAGDAGDSGGSFFGLHTNPGPKAAQARYTTPKGNKYVVFYLDLSFIFLLELKRCSMARGCLQGVKYLMFAFNLLFWVSAGAGRTGEHCSPSDCLEPSPSPVETRVCVQARVHWIGGRSAMRLYWAGEPSHSLCAPPRMPLSLIPAPPLQPASLPRPLPARPAPHGRPTHQALIPQEPEEG